jgi:hypothetical protein
LQDQSQLGSRQILIRKRRTRRHRRNLLVRRIALSILVFGACVCVSVAALHFLSPSLFRRSSAGAARQAAEASREIFLETQQDALRSMEDRPVYPYSIVAGGVRDAQELKWAAEHDPVVAAHYAGFDYDHARVVRLVLARTAYVSYRIGNRVYWTRRRITLKKGETLLTDGNITARTRCANRVEEAPQVAFSSSEPPALKFDEPFPTLGTATSNPPVPYDSSLLSHSTPPALGPTPPLNLYDPFGSGIWTPISPPPVPIGVCGPLKKKPGKGGTEDSSITVAADNKKKKPVDPCGSTGGGGVVPEPGTWLLVASGLATMYAMTRPRLGRI